MNESPLISIITVVYNGEKYLQQTIDSVYNQTYKNIEYIIVDGGSTDNTLNIIKQNETKIAKWVSEPDKGLYDAMNKGAKMASGALIGTINSDDWYELNTVELVVNAYLKAPNKTIFHGYRYDVFDSGEKQVYKFNSSIFRFKYFNMTYSHPSMFISKELYKINSYNIKLKLYADYQFVLTAYLKDATQFVYIDKPLVNFRLGGVSGNGSFFGELKEAFLARKAAKMSLIECAFSYILVLISRPTINLIKTIKN